MVDINTYLLCKPGIAYMMCDAMCCVQAEEICCHEVQNFRSAPVNPRWLTFCFWFSLLLCEKNRYFWQFMCYAWKICVKMFYRLNRRTALVYRVSQCRCNRSQSRGLSRWWMRSSMAVGLVGFLSRDSSRHGLLYSMGCAHDFRRHTTCGSVDIRVKCFQDFLTPLRKT